MKRAMRRIGNGSPPAGSRITRDATIRMTRRRGDEADERAGRRSRASAKPSSRIVFVVEKPTSKLACVRKRRRPLAEPTNTA